MFYSPGKHYVVTMCSISQRIKIYCRLPALSIHCTLSLRWHTLILANNTFYYWTLPHALHNQIYFLSCMSAARHMNRYQSRYKRSKFCPVLDVMISMKNILSEREMLSVFVVPEKNTWPSLGDTDWQVLPEIWELIAQKKKNASYLISQGVVQPADRLLTGQVEMKKRGR